MASVVRYSLLLMSICSHSSQTALTEVTVLMGDLGKDINIQCATEKIPQDGVSMFKKTQEKKEVYFFNKGNFNPKNPYKARVNVSGTFPNLTVTFFNLTVSDIGLYWCEFNMEEKNTPGIGTWLWVTSEESLNPEAECPETVPDIVKIALALCSIITLLCIIVTFYVIPKVNRCCKSGKSTPTKQPQDSVYEVMSRTKLDFATTLINPEYQSVKQLQNTPEVDQEFQ